ncbi:acyl-CoA N-acyltransferase [Hyaloraphidium curvatum]|nr:acyl-CoA N-acyltransferase [Hyaloraphidium curvatum]
MIANRTQTRPERVIMGSDKLPFEIRAAVAEDLPRILELMPRLAQFPLPPERHRDVDAIWSGDADLLRSWAAGPLPGCVVLVAVSETELLGLAFARFREELISHRPSAHLEALVVAASAEGKGIGSALMDAVEKKVVEGGATSLTLHAFATNERARAVYERKGFNGELIRYIKHLD